jgi:hypothetical protein
MNLSHHEFFSDGTFRSPATAVKPTRGCDGIARIAIIALI